MLVRLVRFSQKSGNRAIQTLEATLVQPSIHPDSPQTFDTNGHGTIHVKVGRNRQSGTPRRPTRTPPWPPPPSPPLRHSCRPSCGIREPGCRAPRRGLGRRALRGGRLELGPSRVRAEVRGGHSLWVSSQGSITQSITLPPPRRGRGPQQNSATRVERKVASCVKTNATHPGD